MLTEEDALTAARTTAALNVTYRHIAATAAGVDFNLPLVRGRRAHITTGVINDEAIAAYTTGQCHALAFALAVQTGYPLVAIGDIECCFDEDCAQFPESWGWCGCQVTHLGVLTPQNMFLDIRGERPLWQAVKDYVDEDVAAALRIDPSAPSGVLVVDEACLAWLEDDPSWASIYYDIALSFVDTILTTPAQG